MPAVLEAAKKARSKRKRIRNLKSEDDPTHYVTPDTLRCLLTDDGVPHGLKVELRAALKWCQERGIRGSEVAPEAEGGSTPVPMGRQEEQRVTLPARAAAALNELLTECEGSQLLGRKGQLDQAMPRDSAVILIHGRPQSGKTRLLAEVADRMKSTRKVFHVPPAGAIFQSLARLLELGEYRTLDEIPQFTPSTRNELQARVIEELVHVGGDRLIVMLDDWEEARGDRAAQELQSLADSKRLKRAGIVLASNQPSIPLTSFRDVVRVPVGHLAPDDACVLLGQFLPVRWAGDDVVKSAISLIDADAAAATLLPGVLIAAAEACVRESHEGIDPIDLACAIEGAGAQNLERYLGGLGLDHEQELHLSALCLIAPAFLPTSVQPPAALSGLLDRLEHAGLAERTNEGMHLCGELRVFGPKELLRQRLSLPAQREAVTSIVTALLEDLSVNGGRENYITALAFARTRADDLSPSWSLCQSLTGLLIEATFDNWFPAFAIEDVRSVVGVDDRRDGSALVRFARQALGLVRLDGPSDEFFALGERLSERIGECLTLSPLSPLSLYRTISIFDKALCLAERVHACIRRSLGIRRRVLADLRLWTVNNSGRAGGRSGGPLVIVEWALNTATAMFRSSDGVHARDALDFAINLTNAHSRQGEGTWHRMMYRLDRCRLLDRPTQSGRRDRLQSMADHAFVLANLERGRNSREQAYWISECVRAHEEEVLVHAKDEALPGAVDRVNERIVTVYGECSTWPVSLRCRLSTFCRSVAEQAECHALRSELLERSKSLLDTQVGQLAPRERRLVQKERAKVMRAEARALASGGQTDGAKALLDQAARQLRAALTEDPDPLTYLLYLRSLDQMHDQDRPVLSLTVSDDGLVSGRTRSIPPELSDAITACKAWLLKSGAREFSSDSLLALELWMLTRAWAAEGTLEIKASRAASQGKRSRSAALQAAYSERSAELDRLRQAYGDSAELTLRRVEVERQFVKFDAIESSTLVDSARVLSIFEESMFGHEPNVRIEWAKFLGVLGRLRDSVDLLRDLLADHLSSYHRRAVSIEFAAAVRELCARSALPDSQRGELLRHAKASLEAQGFGSRMARRVGLDLDVELRDPGVPWGALLSVLRLLLACRDSLEVPMHVLRDANASLGGVLSDRDSPNELIQWISRLLLRALLLEIPVAEIGPVQVAQTVCASLELLQPPSGNRHIVLQLWQAQAIVFACELVGSSVPFGTEAHTAQSELRRIRRLRRRALGPLGMAYDEAEARLAKFVE